MEAGEERKRRAYEEVKALYNWDLVASKTVDLYSRVVSARRVVAW